MFKPFKISNILPSRLTRSSVKNSKLDYLNESELKMFSKGVESCTFMYDAKLKGFSELTADILQGAKGKYRQQDSIVTDRSSLRSLASHRLEDNRRAVYGD